MSTFLIQIIAKSNLAEVLAIDSAAIEANNKHLLTNNELLGTNAKLSGKGTSAKKASTKAVETEEKAFANEIKTLTSHTSALKRNAAGMLAMGNAHDKVGYNIGGLSFRLGMWLVPALFLTLSAMTPVIMALIAMAGAALVAGGALAAFLALGALVYWRSQKNGGMYGGYGGPRRPYSTSDQNQSSTGIWTMLFDPIYKVLDSPKLKPAMDNAKLFLQAAIIGLADGIGRFMTALDPGMMGTLENMFLDWLPKAFENLAKWSSRIFALIGPRTLSEMGGLIDWIAGGIEGISVWLDKQGGWDQLEVFFGVIADFCSEFLKMGEAVLPLLNNALAVIWPFPLKPMMEAITKFCETLANNPGMMKTLTEFVRFVVVMAVIVGLIALVVAIISSNITGWILILIGIYLLLATLWDLVTDLLVFILSMGKYVILQLGALAAKVINKVLGTDIDTSEADSMSLGAALSGEYAPERLKAMDAQQGKDRADREKFLSDTWHNIKVSFQSDNSNVTNVVVDDVKTKTGDYDKINSDLAARRTVTL